MDLPQVLRELSRTETGFQAPTWGRVSRCWSRWLWLQDTHTWNRWQGGQQELPNLCSQLLEGLTPIPRPPRPQGARGSTTNIPQPAA